MSQEQVHILASKKFKTVTIVGKFIAPLTRETVTKRALLPYILQQGTEKYPSERALNLKMDGLYGAVYSITGAKKGDNHIITFRLEVANQKYIENETTIMDEALQLLKEIIYSPHIENKAFPAKVMTREKATLKNQISAIIDDKINYANLRLVDNMCAKEDFSVHSTGYIEDLPAITGEQMYAYYEELLQKDRFDLYVIGDFEEAAMREKVSAIFDVKSQERIVADKQAGQSVKEVSEVIEKQDIGQAKLHIGYRTNCTYGADDYAALQVFNGLFGAFPSSKLFINVREKNSLAYYVASRLESHKGLMYVFSGIAADDYEKAKTIIAEQFTAMQQGDFTEEEIASTKDLIISQLHETEDSAGGVIELAYQQVVAGTDIPREVYFANVEKVTKEDVVRVAKAIELDTVYLLTNEGKEEEK